MPLTRSQRRARKNQRVANALRNPGRLASDPVAFRASLENRVQLDENANRGKRDAAPGNWSRRVIAPETIRQPTAALRVATPVRTPTGRIARRAGEPQYTSYVIGSRHPMPVGEDGK